MKKYIVILVIVSIMTQMTACGFSDNVKSTASKVADTASNVVDAAKDKAIEIKDKIVDWYEQVDLSKVEEGWNHAVDFLGSTYAAAMGSQYVQDVGNAINAMKDHINSAKGSARTIASEAGYAAEKWVADTFNIDAIAGGSAYRADVVGSNGLASVDVTTNYGENASLKYYNTANGSASAQAKNILEKYDEYTHTVNSPMTLEQYLDNRGYNKNDMDALYASIYEGQTRIIPEDQLAIAKDYLNGKISRSDDVLKNKTYAETLEKLKDRLEAPDGTTSTPISYEQMQAIAELAQDGEFEPEKFNISTSQIITPKYLIKQSVMSGLTSASLNMAFSMGPDLFSIIKEAALGNGIDDEKLKEIGIDGILSGSLGFVEGSVSCALLTACKAGKFGANMMDVSPNIIGTLTVLVIDAIRYGYSIAKGEITTLDYSNLMAEEIFVAIVAQGVGTLLGILLPMIPFAYMAGSMAGSMVAATGVQTIKSIVLEIKDGGGFEAIVPANVVETASVIKDKIAELNITDRLSSLKDSALSVANDGYIFVKSAFEG